MSNLKVFSIEQLEDLIEKGIIVDENDYRIVYLIIHSARDWPKHVENLDDFIVKLENEIHGELNVLQMNGLLVKYNRDLSKFAWESESISYLLDIFKYTKELDLKLVFKSLSLKYFNTGI